MNAGYDPESFIHFCLGCGRALVRLKLAAESFVELRCPDPGCRRFQRIDGPFPVRLLPKGVGGRPSTCYD